MFPFARGEGRKKTIIPPPKSVRPLMDSRAGNPAAWGCAPGVPEAALGSPVRGEGPSRHHRSGVL